MAPLDDLSDLVARIGAPPPRFGPHGRLIAQGVAIDLVALLLRELAETMLDRRLSFSTGQGEATLTCEVSEGRVQAASLGPNLTVTAFTLEDRHAFLAYARSFLSVATELWVSAKASTLPRGSLGPGISVADLRDGPPMLRPGHLERLMPLKRISKAWMRQDAASAEEHGGKPEALRALRGAAEARLKALRALKSDECNRIFILGPEAGLLTLIALNEGEALLMLLPEDRLGEVFSRARGVAT